MTTDKLIYRNATIEDLPLIVSIYNSTVASRMVTADTEPVTEDSRKGWFVEHTPEHRPLWMIENEQQETIGWISFQSFYGRPAYNQTAEISIYLSETFRGKGYGKSILQYAIDQSPKLGIKTLLGFIFSHNKPSLKLFQTLGFETWAHLPDIAILDNTERSLDILGKRVAK